MHHLAGVSTDAVPEGMSNLGAHLLDLGTSINRSVARALEARCAARPEPATDALALDRFRAAGHEPDDADDLADSFAFHFDALAAEAAGAEVLDERPCPLLLATGHRCALPASHRDSSLTHECLADETVEPTPSSCAEALRQTANLYHEWRIDHAEYTRRNLASWNAIQARGSSFTDRVLAILRGEGTC